MGSGQGDIRDRFREATMKAHCPKCGRFMDVVHRTEDLTMFGVLRTVYNRVKVEYLLYCGNCDDFDVRIVEERLR